MALIKRISIFLLIIVFCFFSILQALIILAPFTNHPVKSDCILILGYALKDGYHPDEWLTERLEKGLELYKQGYAQLIIVSGGPGFKDHLSVAQAMKQWLIEHSVNEKDIIVEDKARNTLENFEFSKNLSQAYSIKSIIVVTNDFHIFRSMLIAKEYYEKCSAASAPSEFLLKRVFAYLREDAAVVKYLFSD